MPRAGRASASHTAARAERWEQERRTRELKERPAAVRMFQSELQESHRTAERRESHRTAKRRESHRTAERRESRRTAERHRMDLEHCSARRTAACCKLAERQVLHMAAEKTHKVAVHRIVVADTVQVVAAVHMDTRHLEGCKPLLIKLAKLR
jgi:hypothetical protein